jgi:signal transduction histidine kinase
MAILLGMGFSFYNRMQRYNSSIAWIERTHEALRELKNLENNFKQLESNQRGFLLTGDSIFLTRYNERIEKVKKSYKRVTILTRHNEAQKDNLNKLNFLIAERLDILDDVMVLYETDRTLFAKRIQAGRQTMDKCEQALDEMEQEELRWLALRRKSKASYEESSSNYSVSSFLFAFVVFVITFLLIIRELTRRFRYQSALEQKITELNQTNAELEQIAYVASHDLQEPLRKIMTFSDMFRLKFSASLPEEGKKLIDRMLHAALRMQGLVEDLMNFTRLVSIKDISQTVSLKTVIEDVHQDMKPAFDEKNVKLSIDLRLPSVTGYPDQLYLLFQCVLDNAVKFSRSDIAPAVFILTQDVTLAEMKSTFKTQYDARHYVKVIVRDNGIGFDNEFAERMFGLFQRLHAQNSSYDGKGIGLTMVKRIMTNHSGYVTALGKTGEGAEFSLYFPVSPDKLS